MIRRWLGRVLFALAAFVLACALAVLVGSRLGAVRELVRREAVTLLSGATTAEVQIGAVSGSLLHTLVLEDLRLRVEGRTVARVPRLEIVYDLLPLLTRELRLVRVALQAPHIRAVRVGGAWQLPQARGGGGAEGGARLMSLGVTLERLVVEHGRVEVALLDAEPPRRLAADGVAVEASARLGPRRLSLDLRSLRLVPRGIALSPVRASASLTTETGGAVRVSALELATARSLVRADAVVARGRHVEARARLAPLAAADVRALLGQSPLTADLRAHLRARGPWRAITTVGHGALEPGGTVVARSVVDATRAPIGWRGRVALDRIDPGAAVAGLPRASLTGRAEARGGGFHPRGPIAYRAVLHDAMIAGHALDRLALEGAGRAGVHRLRGRVAAPLGEIGLRARVALGSPPVYSLAARWTLARLELLVPSAWGWAMGEARAKGQGTDPETRRARADVRVTAASVRGLPVDGGELHAALAGPRLDLASASLRGHELGLRVDASGRMDLARRTAAVTVAAGAELGAIGAYLAKPLAGAATASATADGALDALAVQAMVAVEKPAWSSTSAERVSARAELHGLGGRAPAGHARLDATALRLGMSEPYEASAEADWQRRGWEDHAELALNATSEKARRQELALTAVRTPERTRGTLQRLTVTPPEGPVWRLEHPAAFVVDTAFTTEGMVLAAGPERVALAGRVALTGTSDASLTLDRVSLAPLCVLRDVPPCGGELSARVTLAGTASAPVLNLEAHARDLEVATVAYGAFDLDVRYAELRARLRGVLRHPQAGELRVGGEVPVDLAWSGSRRDLGAAPISLVATADRLDLTVLQALAPRTLHSSAGRLSLDLRLTGSRAAPGVEGRMAIDDARVELAAAGVPYEDVRARLVAHGARLTVDELHARAGDGTLDVRGTAAVPPGGPTALDLSAHFDRFFAVRREAYEAELSGDLSVRGSVAAPDVSGRLAVDRAVVRPAALPASGPSIPHDPTIAVVGTAARNEEESPPPAGTQMGGPLTLALTVAVERNAWIRRNDANIELGGELRVNKAANEPVRLGGEIRLLRGWYAFQGRRFTLDQGTITFIGATPPKPTFDITAVYRTRDYRIEVHITGSAKKPNLALSSDPPLEQADILSVLLFGKPASQLARGQSVALQEQALQLAAGYVMPELRTSVMDALGLDTLEVEMPQGTEGGRVSAGRYVSEDVFVSLGQEFGRRAAQVAGLEYDLGANVSIRGSTTTRGNSAIDLFWRYRY